MTPAELVSSKIAELQSAILAQHPTLPTLLRDIHKNLLANPDVITLLAEEEIAVVVSGLERHTKVSLVTTVKKESKSSSIKKMTVADL